MRTDRIAGFWTQLQHLNAWRLAFAEDEGVRIPLLKEILKHLPKERGDLEFLQDFADDKLILLLTHDHDSRASLQNEAWIATVLAESGAIPCFGAEGSWQNLDKEMEPFRSFPHRDSTAKVAEYLLWEGKLGSVGYLGIVGTQPTTIRGIDDEKLYELARDRLFNNRSEYWQVIERRVPILVDNVLRLMDEQGARVVAVTLSEYNYSQFGATLAKSRVSHAGIRASLEKVEPDHRPEQPFRSHNESLKQGYDPAATTPLEELFNGRADECLRALCRPVSSATKDEQPRSTPASTAETEGIGHSSTSSGIDYDDACRPGDIAKAAIAPAGSEAVKRTEEHERRVRIWSPRVFWALCVVAVTTAAAWEYVRLGLSQLVAYPLGIPTALAICFLATRLNKGWRDTGLASAGLVILGGLWEVLRISQSGFSTWAACSVGSVVLAGFLVLLSFIQRNRKTARVGIVVLVSFICLRSLWQGWPFAPSPETAISWDSLLFLPLAVLAILVIRIAWLRLASTCLVIGLFVGWSLVKLDIPSEMAYPASLVAVSLIVLFILDRKGPALLLEAEQRDISAMRRSAGASGHFCQVGGLVTWSETQGQIGEDVQAVVRECQSTMQEMLQAKVTLKPLWVVVFDRPSSYAAYTKRLIHRPVSAPGYLAGWFRKKIVLCPELAEQFPRTWKELLAQLVCLHLLASNFRVLPQWVQCGLLRLLSSEYWRAAPGTGARMLRAARSRGELSTGQELFAVTTSEFAIISQDKVRCQLFALQCASFVRFLSERYAEKLGKFLRAGSLDGGSFGRCFSLNPDKAMTLWAGWLLEQHTPEGAASPDQASRAMLEPLINDIRDLSASESFRREAIRRLGESGFTCGAQALVKLLDSPSNDLRNDALRSLENIAGGTRGSEPGVWQNWIEGASDMHRPGQPVDS